MSASEILSPHRTLADVVWPTSSDSGMRALRLVVLIALGVLVLAIASKVNIPLPMVPMTMQTLMVLLIGVIYGPLIGVLTMLAYLLVGIAGVPVFSGNRTGMAAMMGPTGGYLFGFVVGAWVVGMLSLRGRECTLLKIFILLLIGHAVIVFFGFLWLAFGVNFGVEKAFMVGVVSFVSAAVFKSALGALVLAVARKLTMKADIC